MPVGLPRESRAHGDETGRSDQTLQADSPRPVRRQRAVTWPRTGRLGRCDASRPASPRHSGPPYGNPPAAAGAGKLADDHLAAGSMGIQRRQAPAASMRAVIGSFLATTINPSRLRRRSDRSTGRRRAGRRRRCPRAPRTARHLHQHGDLRDRTSFRWRRESVSARAPAAAPPRRCRSGRSARPGSGSTASTSVARSAAAASAPKSTSAAKKALAGPGTGAMATLCASRPASQSSPPAAAGSAPSFCSRDSFASPCSRTASR